MSDGRAFGGKKWLRNYRKMLTYQLHSAQTNLQRAASAGGPQQYQADGNLQHQRNKIVQLNTYNMLWLDTEAEFGIREVARISSGIRKPA